MQLVAYGAQDIYLTGNPQITFFKVVYRRHTNFSMEAIEQTFNGTVGGRQTATISRNGDLVSRMYLEFGNVGDGDGEFNPGHNSIDNIELEIGGQRIDRQYGHWMEAWAELTESNGAAVVRDENGSTATDGTKFQNLAGAGGCISGQAMSCIVPLQFWFCRNPGLALPLIALQYHEVKVIVNWSNTMGTPNNEKLYADYIYLDTDERRRFAQVSHEYLIEQVQYQSTTAVAPSADITLNFNHPVKELIFTGLTAAATGVRNTVTGSEILLKLNGHDRFSARPFTYFTQTQVWQHHTGTPISMTTGSTGGVGKASVNEIGVYSFALKPEEHQPSGTCNFSRIDNAQLKGIVVAGANDGVNVYAVNYNVLRIMSGMGGLAYSN